MVRFLPLRNSKSKIIEGRRQQKKRPPRKSNRQPKHIFLLTGKEHLRERLWIVFLSLESVCPEGKL